TAAAVRKSLRSATGSFVPRLRTTFGRLPAPARPSFSPAKIRNQWRRSAIAALSLSTEESYSQARRARHREYQSWQYVMVDHHEEQPQDLDAHLQDEERGTVNAKRAANSRPVAAHNHCMTHESATGSL